MKKEMLNIQSLIFYLLVLFGKLFVLLKLRKKLTPSLYRVKYTIDAIKYNLKKNQKLYVILVSICVLIISIINLFPKDLRIHFVDVGQGDCCFIETPSNKTILIDGGGSENDSYDVGEKTLIPYILDRGYTNIDYIFISHFDTDHVRADY